MSVSLENYWERTETPVPNLDYSPMIMYCCDIGGIKLRVRWDHDDKAWYLFPFGKLRFADLEDAKPAAVEQGIKHARQQQRTLKACEEILVAERKRQKNASN